MSNGDFEAIADEMGEDNPRAYGDAFSDITQRVIPSIVLAAYPEHKITKALALRLIKQAQPTPPLTSEQSADEIHGG